VKHKGTQQNKQQFKRTKSSKNLFSKTEYKIFFVVYSVENFTHPFQKLWKSLFN